MTKEVMDGQGFQDATLIRAAGHVEKSFVHGVYTVECRGPDGELKWTDTADNVVATVGKNLFLDTGLAGSAYTVVGPYMGLLSLVGWSATAAGDTMTSHSGWTEAGITNAPTYSGGRKTCAWSAASAGAKALSAALTFTFTGAGTVEGLFIVFGTGAVNTVDNTAGTLFSAGAFSGGAKAVGIGDSISASYSVSV